MNFTTKINNWYSVNKRNLPWRSISNPYFIWLSEIILQQTQIKQGLPYYTAFTETFPTVFDLANAPEEQVLKLWQGLGYYSRARNLHATAKYVANTLNGEFPKTYDGLIQLKGVGDYTASAIASICFNEPKAVVDGNVYRVLSRYFGVDTPINTTQGNKVFKALAEEVLDVTRPGDHNQAIMEYGARQCKPKNPDCSVCELQPKCVAFAEDKVQSLPVKLKTTKVIKKHFNFLVVQSQNKHTVIEQRTAKGIWQHLYQFPLLETSRSAELQTVETHLKTLPWLQDKPFSLSLYNTKPIVHKLSHQHLVTKFWIVDVDDAIELGIPYNTIHKYPVPILIGKFIDAFNF